jgi:phage baseplate assembly protein W
MVNYNEYLGRGLGYPLQVVNGSPQLVLGVALIEQSIKRILSTPVGSTFFNRAFGSRLFMLMGKPVNGATETLLDIVINEALEKWENRIEVGNITYQRKDSFINCLINYKILASNEVQTFVYPFYNSIEY